MDRRLADAALEVEDIRKRRPLDAVRVDDAQSDGVCLVEADLQVSLGVLANVGGLVNKVTLHLRVRVGDAGHRDDGEVAAELLFVPREVESYVAGVEDCQPADNAGADDDGAKSDSLVVEVHLGALAGAGDGHEGLFLAEHERREVVAEGAGALERSVAHREHACLLRLEHDGRVGGDGEPLPGVLVVHAALEGEGRRDAALALHSYLNLLVVADLHGAEADGLRRDLNLWHGSLAGDENGDLC